MQAKEAAYHAVFTSILAHIHIHTVMDAQVVCCLKWNVILLKSFLVSIAVKRMKYVVCASG